MQGCLSIFVIFILLALLIKFPLQSIGTLIAIWAIYEWRINKKLGAKSRKPAVILLCGILIAFFGLGLSDDTDHPNQVKDAASTSQKSTEKRNESQNESQNESKEQAKKDHSPPPQTSSNHKNSQDALIKKFGLELATVSKVIDGDTFELSDGRKVRLIGVNTPESTTRTEEYGKEASNYTKSKIQGRQVYLQKDVSETDRYGRLLRIVWLKVPTDDMEESEIRSKMFNADLVINGYAEPSTYPPMSNMPSFLENLPVKQGKRMSGCGPLEKTGRREAILTPSVQDRPVPAAVIAQTAPADPEASIQADRGLQTSVFHHPEDWSILPIVRN
jgi:micrococcal nuclease